MNSTQAALKRSDEVILLGEKLSPPHLPDDAVPRDRLLLELARRTARVLLVCAPVGYGKSTLLGQCHRAAVQQGLPAVWLTLDERDNDLARLLLYLREAVKRLGQATTQAPAETPVSQEVGSLMERQSQQVIEAFARLDGPFLLVLDDVEKLHDAAGLALIQTLGQRLREGQCLALGSRTVPALTLATWRSQGRLVQIDAAALRFESAELTDFLARQPQLQLDHSVHALLHHRTDGWPGAVRLAVLALQGVPDPAHWLQTLSGGNEDIAAYLVENVLSQQTPQRRAFLLGTCVMEAFDAAACDHVLARDDSAAELAEIARSNLFLTSLDGQGRWYRYHAMFREFLQQQLQREQPRQAATLRRRAATWFAAQQRYMDAVSLALASGDMALTVQIVDSCALHFVRSGWLRTLQGWLDALPAEAFAQHRNLQRARAYTMIALHRHADALPALEALRAGADPEAAWELDVQILLMHSWMDQQHKVLALRDEMLPRYHAAPRTDVLSRGIFCNVMVYTHSFSHDRLGARAWLPEAKACVEQRPDAWSSSYTLCFEGMLDMIEGRAADALQRFEQACRHAAAGGLAAAYAYRAGALYEMDRLDEAQACLDPWLEEIRSSGAPDVLILGLRTAARIAHATQRGSQRHTGLLNQLIDLAEARGQPRVKAAALLEKAHLALLDGHLESAGDHLAAGSAAALWAPTQGLRLYTQEVDDVFVASARMAIAVGNGAAMIEPLEAALQQAHEQGRRWRKLRLQTLLVQALSQSRKRSQALQLLEDTLLAAHQGGFTRVVTDCPWRLQELIDELVPRSRRIEAASLARLSRLTEAAGRCFRAITPTVSDEARLTAKELEVLKLAARGHANKAIAGEMGISDNTVETHLRHAYTKLGARNRLQAIEQAREMGWL